jgi:hypothetical protein
MAEIAGNSISSSTQAVVDAYISMAQDLDQSAQVLQILSVNCSSLAKSGGCLKCEEIWATKFKNDPSSIPSGGEDEFVQKECASLCTCNASNINLSQNVNINWQIFANNSTSASFKNRVVNNINQSTSTSSTGAIIPNTSKNLTNSIDQVYTRLKSTTMQKSLQQLQQQQTVSLVGAGSIANVTMNQAQTYVAAAILSDSVTASLLSQVETTILAITTQTMDAGFAELAEVLVRLILGVVLLVVLLYTSSLVFEVFSLYA